MPRKWQKYDRVRGVALSQKRFQFIFNHEHDLEDVYNKGVHTFNDWVEYPPSGPEKLVREHRIKSSLADLWNDPIAQKSFLSLESIPIITNEIDKGKCPVFEYQSLVPSKLTPQSSGYQNTLLASAIQAGRVINEASRPEYFCSEGSGNSFYENSTAYLDFSSANSVNVGEASSSGTARGINSGKARRRPSRSQRKPNEAIIQFNYPSNLIPVVKRKADEKEKQGSSIKRKLNEAVQMEGLPKDL